MNLLRSNALKPSNAETLDFPNAVKFWQLKVMNGELINAINPDCLLALRQDNIGGGGFSQHPHDLIVPYSQARRRELGREAE